PRSVLVSAPLAVVATMSAVTMGVLAADPATSDNTDYLASSGTTSLYDAADATAAAKAAEAAKGSSALSRRTDLPVSRSQIRTAAKA
ncbi:hypothetical protein ABI023_14735, partial [Enterococcus faecium]|uniref:hypothetical protein n=1 Tax=Enterococcus faecium TaxID=1352 RepID=UPI003F424055